MDTDKNFPCFTSQQQKLYDSLDQSRKKYVIYRSQGYGKTQSAQLAGFDKNARQIANNIEARQPELRGLYETLATVSTAKSINEKDSALNKTIDALAMQDSAEDMLAKVGAADGETAKRIKFYRDVMNGTIKDTKKVVRKDAEGKIIETRLEESSSVQQKMQARKELDRLLGLSSIISLDSIKMGDVTINIVDATKKEALEDKRNTVDIIQHDEEEEVVEDVKPTEDGEPF